MTRPLVLGLALCILACPGPAQAAQKHPRLHQAVYEMREAHAEMEGAGIDFGGHKTRALLALRAAYEETELALKAAGEPYEGFRPPPNLYGSYADYPHLRHAKVEMGEAKKALERAVGPFDGHRVKAIENLRIAITSVERSLESAR